MKKKVVIVIIGIILMSTINFVSLPAKDIVNSKVSDNEDDIHIVPEKNTKSSIDDAASTMDIHFKWVGAATFIITIDDLKIACDPALDPDAEGRVEDPVYTDEDFQNIDLWLITHKHEDHLDEIGLTKIDSEALVITHEIAVEMLQTTESPNINILEWKEKRITNIDDFNITIEAIPALHGTNPITIFLMEGVNGYWVTLEKNGQTISIYITGDTTTKWKVINSLRGRKADLFIPFMGEARIPIPILRMLLGPLTLNARMMRRMKRIINPEITIPVHFGTFSHYCEPISKVDQWNDPSIKILSPGENITINL
ncbi:MAG: MBL fold metallo-hydrolase [Thermoplasmatales archaeon]|nr:MBL fold metallo-hydrolase [Thermoplasmatales archaeon]